MCKLVQRLFATLFLGPSAAAHTSQTWAVTACRAVHACSPLDSTKAFYATCALLQQTACATVVNADTLKHSEGNNLQPAVSALPADVPFVSLD